MIAQLVHPPDYIDVRIVLFLNQEMQQKKWYDYGNGQIYKVFPAYNTPTTWAHCTMAVQYVVASFKYLNLSFFNIAHAVPWILPCTLMIHAGAKVQEKLLECGQVGSQVGPGSVCARYN